MRTVNRKPWTVNVIDEDDMGYKYFNHYNWKGLYDNKNFLGVDQESFEYCTNVYVDSEGLLCSRPSLKVAFLPDGITNVIRVESYPGVDAYIWMQGTDRMLSFVYDGGITNPTVINGNYKLVLADNKIFVFTTDNLQYFDIVNPSKALQDGTDKIYIPDATESPNLLTTTVEKRIEYATPDTDVSEAVGKNTKVTIDGTTYVVNPFPTNAQKGFLSQLTELDSNEFTRIRISDPLVLPAKYDYIPNVIVKGNTVMIYKYDSSNKKYTIRYYFTTGTTWYNITDLPSQEYAADKTPPTHPWLSEDGYHICYATLSAINKVEVWAISIVATEEGGTKKWSDWTKITTVTLPTGLTAIPSVKMHMPTKEDIFVFSYYTGDTIAHIDSFVWHNGTTASSELPRSFGATYTTDITIITSAAIIVGNTITTATGTPQPYDVFYTTKVNITKNTAVSTTTSKNRLFVWRIRRNTDLSITVNTYTVFTDSGSWEVDKLYQYDAKCNIVSEVQQLLLFGPNFGKYQEVAFTLSDTITTPPWVNSSSVIGQRVITGISGTVRVDADSYDTYKYIVNGKYSTDIYTVNITPDVSTKPVAVISDRAYYASRGTNAYLYTTYPLSTITIDIINQGASKIIVPDIVTQLDGYFFAFDDDVYISKIGAKADVDNFQWYIPKDQTQNFPEPILNMHAISSTDVAIFFENSIYYITKSEGNYYINKSKIPLGVKKGSDIVTSYDGKYTIFSTSRGLVAMAYQDFVASTEQALTYLSDNIFSIYDKWNVSPIKLCQYKFWLICYRTDSKTAYVYDMRNGSWWPVTVPDFVNEVTELDYKLTVISEGKLLNTDTGTTNYKDYNTEVIDWEVRSQKLHFNASNFYKHICSVTFNAVTDNDNKFTFRMRATNYRKLVSEKQPETLEYKVDVIRTFVKRFNFAKVSEFQYSLYNNNEDARPQPFAITNLAVKYKITGNAR